MSQNLKALKRLIDTKLADTLASSKMAYGELTIEVPKQSIRAVCQQLRDDKTLDFSIAVDVTAVDYLHYGQGDWQTSSATSSGFDRGIVPRAEICSSWTKPRFAVIYHLLSIHHNWRLRVKTFVSEDDLVIDSVINVWQGVNWFEREVFDLFGIMFKGHPDLRRILTDYGFVGHPLRKDFPVTGNVEVRYDHEQGRVIYQPVTIDERILVPKVIRNPNQDQLFYNEHLEQPSEGEVDHAK